MKDINLLPDDLKSKNDPRFRIDELRDKLDPKIILISIVVVLGLLVIFFVPLLYSKILEQKTASLEADVIDTKFDVVKLMRKNIEAENAEVNKKKKVMTEIDNTNLSLSEMFSAVNGIMPEGCTIESLMYDATKGISVKGKVKENIQVGEIITRAKRLKFLIIDKDSAISYDDQKNFNFNFKIAGMKVR